MITGGDGPGDERAEIIEIANQPIARSGDRAADAPRSQPPESGVRSPSRRRGAIAFAGVALVVGLAVVVSQSNVVSKVLPTHAPEPSSPFPATAAGLPVISVAAATAKGAEEPRVPAELAVGGWLTAILNLQVCHSTGQAVVPCSEPWTTHLLSSATPLFGPDGATLPQPDGASALQTVFVAPIRKPDLPVTNPLETHPTVEPTPLVLVGHFHDDRASGCPAASVQALACDPAFVVDAVANLSGIVQANGAHGTGLTTALSPADVVALVRGHVQPGGVVLDFGPVRWLPDGRDFSPVEADPSGPSADGRSVWLVRGHLAGAPSWLAIDDATGQMWGPLASAPSVIPLAGGFPTTIEGLRVQSVGQALQAISPSGSCCSYVAVGGYLSNNRAPEGCPLAQTTGKPNACSDTQLALLDSPGTILVANDATFLYDLVPPSGFPAIRPLVLPGTTAPDPWASVSGLAANVQPREVILIGQFGDPRSPECAARPGGGNAGCDLSFVVDQVAWIAGVAQGPSVWIGLGDGVKPIHTPSQVIQAVTQGLGSGNSSSIISLTAATAANLTELTGIPSNDPAAPNIWIIRMTVSSQVGPAQPSRSLVLDSTLQDPNAGP